MSALVDKLRSVLGAREQTADGKTLVSRAEAAQMCVEVLGRAGIGAIPYLPRGNEGRVAVLAFLLTRERRTPLGWIEIPLTGEITLHREETAIAVAIAERIAPLIAATFAAHVVRPMPADARTWVLGDRRVAQAPNGLWLVTNGAGAVLASADTYDEARRALEAPASQDGGLIASSSRDLPIEMERDHAARWVQKQLREHGYETHVEGSTITLVLPGRSPILRVSPAGLLVDPNVPSLARLVAEAALRNVGVVERLE